MRATKARNSLEKHFGAVTHIKSFPTNSNENIFVSGARDGMLHVWSGNNGDFIQTAAAHRGVIQSISIFNALLPRNSIQFCSSGSDGMLKIWELNQKLRSARNNSRGDASQLVYKLNNTAELSVGYQTRTAYCPHQNALCAGVYTMGATVDMGHLWRNSANKFVGNQTAPAAVNGSLDSVGSKLDPGKSNGTSKTNSGVGYTSVEITMGRNMGGCTDMVSVQRSNASENSIAYNSYIMAASYNSGAIQLLTS